MVTKFANTIIDVKINNQQSAIAQNTPEAGEAFKLAGKLKTIAVAKKPAKIAQGKPAIVKLKKGDIDPSKVIVKGSVSSSGFMVMTYSPRDPKNPEHRKAAEAAQKHSLDIQFAFWTGAAEKVSGWVKPVLDNSVGFALDALSQNHIEASKKAQGWIGLGKATIALAQKANADKPKAVVKLAELVVVKPFMAVYDGINASVAKSAAGDDIGAAKALGGAVAMVSAIAQAGIHAPKIVKGSVKIAGGLAKNTSKAAVKGARQLPKGIGGVGGKLPAGSEPIIGKLVKAVGETKNGITSQQVAAEIKLRELAVQNGGTDISRANKHGGGQVYAQTTPAGEFGDSRFIHTDPQPEPRNLTPLEEFRAAGDKLAEQNRAAGSSPYKRNLASGSKTQQNTPSNDSPIRASTDSIKNLYYKKLVETLKIEIDQNHIYAQYPEVVARINQILSNELINLLNNPATRVDALKVLNAKIPIKVVNNFTVSRFDAEISISTGKVLNGSIVIGSELFANMIMNRNGSKQAFQFAFINSINEASFKLSSKNVFWTPIEKYKPTSQSTRSLEKTAYISDYVHNELKRNIISNRKIITYNGEILSILPKGLEEIFFHKGKKTGSIKLENVENLIKYFEVNNSQMISDLKKVASDIYDIKYPK
jgi:hypothetical protein